MYFLKTLFPESVTVTFDLLISMFK